jgi:tetratricopeptide (TPR) repeat protein
VLDATNRAQVPWDNSSLVGEVYLSAGQQAAPAPTVAPAAANAASSSLPGSDTAELLFWQSVARDDSKEMYQGYLSRYGDKGQFAFIARQRIEALSKVAALPPPAAPTPASARNTPEVPPADTAAKPGGAPVNDCDRDAAPVLAMVKPPGIDGKDIAAIDPVAAVAACQSASQQYPDEARFKYYLGRAQIAAKNFIEANQSYEAAIKAGSVDAISGLAVSYYLGRGVPQNYQRAFELFSKGDELNEPNAMSGLGQMYADGHFVPKDPAKAQRISARRLRAAITSRCAASVFSITAATACRATTPWRSIISSRPLPMAMRRRWAISA